MQPTRAPLFVSGCPRSGTSAVATWLNTSGKIALGIERYQRHWKNHREFPESFLAKERFFGIQEGDTWYADLNQFREHYDSLKNRWDSAVLVGDKIPSFWENLPGLFTTFPSAKLVHVIRDPLSVARSYKARSLDPKDTNWGAHRDVAAAINHWNASNSAVLRFMRTPKWSSVASQIFLLRYEDFITNCIDVGAVEVFLGGSFGLSRLTSSAKTVAPKPDLLTEAERSMIFALTDRQLAEEVDQLVEEQRLARLVSAVSSQAGRRQWYHKADSDVAHIEYGEHLLKGCNYVFRGRAKPIDFNAPFIAAIGSATTFGRFLKAPYPDLIEEQTSMPVLNLGIGGARPETFLANDSLVAVLKKAQVVILELMSARGYRSPIFHPSDPAGNSGRFVDYFGLRGSTKDDPSLASLFSLEDAGKPVFVDWVYERTFAHLDKPRRDFVRDVIVTQYCRDTRKLIEQIGRPVVALFVSKTNPSSIRSNPNPVNYEQWAGSHPHFVDSVVLDFIRGLSIPLVFSQSVAGLPYQVIDQVSHVPAPVFPWQVDPSLNTYYPSQEMHRDAAEKLLRVLPSVVPGLMESP